MLSCCGCLWISFAVGCLHWFYCGTACIQVCGLFAMLACRLLMVYGLFVDFDSFAHLPVLLVIYVAVLSLVLVATVTWFELVFAFVFCLVVL